MAIKTHSYCALILTNISCLRFLIAKSMSSNICWIVSYSLCSPRKKTIDILKLEVAYWESLNCNCKPYSSAFRIMLPPIAFSFLLQEVFAWSLHFFSLMFIAQNLVVTNNMNDMLLLMKSRCLCNTLCITCISSRQFPWFPR